MANSDAKLPTNEPVKFDYAKFFRYVRESARPPLRQLLRAIGQQACIEVASYVSQYLQPREKEAGLVERRQRGAKIKRVLPQAIASLRKAAAKYREVAAIEIPGAGSLITARAPLRPQGFPFLADELESEAARFSKLLEISKQLFRTKRFGVSANHLWLIFLEEFVAAWTEQELGEARTLQSDEIATLIEAGKIALGGSLEESEIDAELIGKAIRNLRSNRDNAEILGLSAKHAWEHCQVVRDRRFLIPGIEI
jgi:hypothetical protein